MAMTAATLVPRQDTLIEIDHKHVFLEPRHPTTKDLKTNPKAQTTYTPTVNIYYEAELDKWVVIPKDSRNPDGSKRGMILFVLGPVTSITTHIRVISITQNGRGARGVPITL